MDPNEALKRLRELSQQVLDAPGEDGNPHAADEMAELFQTLDAWLCKDGFKPSDWTRMKWS